MPASTALRYARNDNRRREALIEHIERTAPYFDVITALRQTGDRAFVEEICHSERSRGISGLYQGISDCLWNEKIQRCLDPFDSA
jgi:hypothetical protein